MRHYWMICALMMALPVLGVSLEGSDTTIYYEGKRFELSASDDPVEVRVYSKRGERMEQVYEGIYENGEKKSSKWDVKEVFSVPFLDQKRVSPTPKKEKQKQKGQRTYYYFEPSWSGIGVGFIAPTGCDFSVIRDPNDEGIMFDESRSFELFLNVFDFGMPLYKDRLGITTGVGLNWRNMSLADNKVFKSLNGYGLGIESKGSGVRYSTMMTIDVVVPLMIEWKLGSRRSSGFFLSAGIQANVKTYSCVKSKFFDQGQDRKTFIRGIGSKPLSVDALAMFGFDHFSIYMKHALTPMFTTGRGPEFYPTSIGLMFNF